MRYSEPDYRPSTTVGKYTKRTTAEFTAGQLRVIYNALKSYEGNRAVERHNADEVELIIETTLSQEGVAKEDI